MPKLTGRSQIGVVALAVLCIGAARGYGQELRHDSVPPDASLKAGDIIQVRIWREPELSGEYRVDVGLQTILPLLGRLDVSEKSSAQIVDELIESYSRFLKNPSIQITVLRRVSVQGEVRNPGLYPVDATISLADVLALAGGLLPDANPEKIQLVREGAVLDVELRPETIVERSPIQSGDQVYVHRKSWFSRNAAVILAATITGVAIILGNVAFR